MRAEPALLLALLGCGGVSAQANEPPPEASVTDCSATLAAGDDVEAHVAEGAVLCLQAGVHRVNLDLRVGLTLRGEPGAILDGGRGGPVVRVGEHGKQIRLEQLEIRGGAYEMGSGVLVEGYSDVVIRDCAFVGNARGPGGGNGLAARRGTLQVERTRFGAADEVLVTTVVEASFRDCAVEGTLRVEDGAQVTVSGGTVGTVRLRGTSTRRPSVDLQGAAAGSVDNTAAWPGTVTGP